MSDSGAEFEIRFEGLSLADAGKMANKLRDELARTLPEHAPEIRKDDPSNQDFGATLVLVLGTPAVLALANGIASWLKRNRATISITEHGHVVAKNISGEDATRIAEAFSRSKK